MERKSIIALVGATGLSLAACASGPSVRPQLTKTTGAVRAAEEVGAQNLPQAALHLKLAKESLKRGESYADEDEPAAARRALERAEIDAELAIALVKENRAKSDLQSVESQLAELEQPQQAQPAQPAQNN